MTDTEFMKRLLGIFAYAAPTYASATYKTYNVTDVPTTDDVNMPAVKSVIFNKNATVVYFADGTRAIVRKSAQDEYNREHAVVYAIVKRAYGKVGPDGIVEGCGMGNMLSKVVENGYDQEAHDAEERAKRAAKRNAQRNCNCDSCTTEKVAPWPTTKRDNKGRFVKKANRK